MTQVIKEFNEINGNEYESICISDDHKILCEFVKVDEIGKNMDLFLQEYLDELLN